MAATRIGSPRRRLMYPRRPTARPASSALETLILRASDERGLTCPDVRALAAAADTTTVVIRGAIRSLVRVERLRALGNGVYAVAGMPAAALARESSQTDPDASTASWPGAPSSAAPGADPRTPPHRMLHEGRGSTALW